MKYNFKGYFNLGVIFLLIVLLLGVLGKTIFTEQNISYNKTNDYQVTWTKSFLVYFYPTFCPPCRIFVRAI